MIRVKRIYDKPEKSDGARILVDRLWPRGASKREVRVDMWLKDVAPSPDLRIWFSHDRKKFSEFKILYVRELKDKKDILGQIKQMAGEKNVTLLYAAKDPKCNHAIVLCDYLNKNVRA